MTKKKVKLTTFGKIWRATICILAPLGGGFLISMLTRDAFSQFGGFNQPPLSPPAWLFPVAWTILYVLMGGGVVFDLYWFGARSGVGAFD